MPKIDSINGLSVRFRAVRKHLKLAQIDIAKRYSVGISTWKRAETGQMPKGDLLTALSLDGFNINWLLTGEGEMLRQDAEGLNHHAAEAAAIALSITVRGAPGEMSEAAQRAIFRDFYRGFMDAAGEDLV